MTALRDFQAAFGRRIRAGAGAPRPAGVPARRMAVYEELLFNNLRGFLDPCFPVCRACLGELRWARLCRRFFREWPSRTSWFREIPRDFVAWLDDARPTRLPRWFAELARYEWAELAVELMDVGAPAADPAGDLVDGVPLVNPAALALAFEWPVHRIGPVFLPRRTAPVHLRVYRDRQDAVCFIELSPATARLLALLDGATSGRTAIERLAGELGRPADPAFVEFGRHNLEALRHSGVIVGERV